MTRLWRRCLAVVAVWCVLSGAVSAQGTIEIIGTQKLPPNCTTGQVPTYSTTTLVWACATPTSGQPLDTDLTAIAALVSAADKCPYATAAGTWALTDCPSFGRSLMTLTSAAGLTALGVVPVASPTFTGAVTLAYTAGGTAPTVADVGAASCGTTAATLAGTDNAGAITVGGTAGTQCRITLTRAAPTRWHCTANNSTTANIARVTPVDTTHVDVLGTFVGGDVVDYICTPH